MSKSKPYIDPDDLSDQEVIDRAVELIAKAVVDLVKETLEKKKKDTPTNGKMSNEKDAPLYIEDHVRIEKTISPDQP